MSKQLICTNNNDDLNASTTEYIKIAGSQTWSATLWRNRFYCSSAGTFSNLRVALSTAPGDGKSHTITMRKNDVSQTLTVTLSGAEVVDADLVNSFTVNVGDYVDYMSEHSGTPAVSDCGISVQFESTNDGETLLAFAHSNDLHATATEYCGFGSGGENGDFFTTEPTFTNVVSIDATAKNLRVVLENAPGAGKSFTFTLRKNNTTDTDVVVTVSDSETADNSGALTGDIVPGDWMYIKCVPSGTPTVGNYAYGMTLLVDTAGESLPSSPQYSLNAADTSYCSLSGSYDQTTEAAVSISIISFACIFKKTYIKLSGSPGAGKSYTITLREYNTADTDIVVTISDAETYGVDITHTFNALAADYLIWKVVPVGTPTSLHGDFSICSDSNTAVSVTVTPSVLSIAVNMIASSLITNNTISVNVNTITANILAPTIVTAGDIIVTPSVIGLTNTLISLSLSVDSILSTNIIGLIINEISPTISVGSTITTNVVTLIANLIAPNILAGGNITVIISVLGIIITMNSVSISTDNVLSMNLVKLIVNENSPILSAGLTVNTNLINLLANTQNISILNDVVLTANVISLITNLLSLSANANANIVVNNASLTTTLNLIALSADSLISTGVISIVSNTINISVATDNIITLTVKSLTVTLNPAVMDAGIHAIISLSVATLTINMVTLSVSAIVESMILRVFRVEFRDFITHSDNITNNIQIENRMRPYLTNIDGI